ncbi:hypothetical protein ACJX0J_038836, partial [Zea mays]
KHLKMAIVYPSIHMQTKAETLYFLIGIAQIHHKHKKQDLQEIHTDLENSQTGFSIWIFFLETPRLHAAFFFFFAKAATFSLYINAWLYILTSQHFYFY